LSSTYWLTVRTNMEISINEVVYDESIYPRSSWSDEVVEQYKEAIESGKILPNIILETATNRLIDGMHRWKARQQLNQETIEVEYRDIPKGIPAKLYSASLNSEHGHQFSKAELKNLVRDIVAKDPEFNLNTISKMIARSERTLERWVSDLIEDRKKREERERRQRQIKVHIMTEASLSNREIARKLGVALGTVFSDRQVSEAEHNDDLYSEAELWHAAGELRDIVDNVGDVVERILTKRLPPMKIVLSAAFAKWRLSGKKIIEIVEKYRHVTDEESLRTQMADNILKTIKILEATAELLRDPSISTITDQDVEDFFKENHE